MSLLCQWTRYVAAEMLGEGVADGKPCSSGAIKQQATKQGQA